MGPSATPAARRETSDVSALVSAPLRRRWAAWASTEAVHGCSAVAAEVVSCELSMLCKMGREGIKHTKGQAGDKLHTECVCRVTQTSCNESVHNSAPSPNEQQLLNPDVKNTTKTGVTETIRTACCMQ